MIMAITTVKIVASIIMIAIIIITIFLAYIVLKYDNTIEKKENKENENTVRRRWRIYFKRK